MCESNEKAKMESPIGRRIESIWLYTSITLGAILPPISMAIGWLYFKDVVGAQKVGMIIVNISLLIVAIASARVFHFSSKLKAVSHSQKNDVHGIFGSIKKEGLVIYHFSEFSEADVQTYKKMYYWAILGGFACTAFFGWFFTIFFIHQVFGGKN